MSSSLERVQHDLDVNRSALPSDFPYDHGNIALSLLAGLCGIPLALRAVPGWNRPMLIVLALCFAVLFAAYGRWLQRVRAERAARPRRWSWNREETLCSLLAVLGLVAYVVITRWSAGLQGEWNFTAWRGQVAGPVLFAFGVGLVSVGSVQSMRRSWLGWGLSVLVVGAAAPWVTSMPVFHVLMGVAMALGGLLSAAILWRQLRTAEAAT